MYIYHPRFPPSFPLSHFPTRRAIVEEGRQRYQENIYKYASSIEKDIVIYDRNDMNLRDETERLAIEAEMREVFSTGGGIVVIKNSYSDMDIIDQTSAAFRKILAVESEKGAGGDHFAKGGANGRIWNALEKLAVEEPEVFVQYYSNSIVALASRAWLGPCYQTTSQVNIVFPGGQRQEPHRDYNLGFQTNDETEKYPPHVHTAISPQLTLQGGVAHCDMPLESGPTMFLPHSHKYAQGYLAWRSEDFKQYYLNNYVQLPLAKGDTVFFNPAVIHGAGTNHSPDIEREVNLLQICSAFGRSMEVVDRSRMCKALYPSLVDFYAQDNSDDKELTANTIASSAEGYSFPANLDLDQPMGGLAPETQAAMVQRALSSSMSIEDFNTMIDAYDTKRLSQ